ncbi:hypothetical protein BECAL_01756 [Bellilinea caldifistulae]|uniref:Uncharacterized protein n=1 Tax=Bellilinea caldifistulae TaxID=360411 RepID=A0A0P6X1X5_9CHLR|nr:hypothetical protein AC812_10565 [Bellilinea caldifistulae]GAP10583.1 hypothetical protein BECAL_01756 [Bellilinea caldifistulae]
MSKKIPVTSVNPILDMLKKAVSVQNGPDIYCNHAQIHLSINDMIIDLSLNSRNWRQASKLSRYDLLVDTETNDHIPCQYLEP